MKRHKQKRRDYYINNRPFSSTRDSWNSRGHKQLTAARAPETIETSAAEGMLTTEETLSTAVMVTSSGTSKQRL
jgi:hypothetical protein